jgi:hypothetical protein
MAKAKTGSGSQKNQEKQEKRHYVRYRPEETRVKHYDETPIERPE